MTANPRAPSGAQLRAERIGRFFPDLDPNVLSSCVEHTSRLVGITSSRLGSDVIRKRAVARFLVSAIQRCRQQQATALIAVGSAIETLAVHGCEKLKTNYLLLDVDRINLSLTSARSSPSKSETLSRDAVIAFVSDQVEAIYARTGGKIEEVLLKRLEFQLAGSVQVAVTSQAGCAAKRLIEHGAIGRWARPEVAPNSASRSSALPRCCGDSWMAQSGWLVHCTRANPGHWVDQSMESFMDHLLFGDGSVVNRNAVDTLARILSQKCLRAGNATTRRTHRVVCFSEMPLRGLLERRCYRSHLRRWDYEPYGIAIRREAAARLGIRPVIYGEPSELEAIPVEDQFRFHPRGRDGKWEQEREWRADGDVDLTSLAADDVRVFVSAASDLQTLPGNLPWPVAVVGNLASAKSLSNNSGKCL